MSDKEYIKKLEEALSESLSLNINWTGDASDEDLNYYSEHRAVIKQAKETLKLSKNPNMHKWWCIGYSDGVDDYSRTLDL
jgi:hypothetical protein